MGRPASRRELKIRLFYWLFILGRPARRAFGATLNQRVPSSSLGRPTSKIKVLRQAPYRRVISALVASRRDRQRAACCLERLLGPAIIQLPVNPFLARSSAMLSLPAQPGSHDPEFFFGRVLPLHRTPDDPDLAQLPLDAAHC
jgi:hypothetical protein